MGDSPPRGSSGTSATGIPTSLRPWFQEFEFGALDPVRHAGLIIERVLAYGSRHELRWLFRRYGRAVVTDWMQQRGARRLPWRRYNLWCVLLDLPPARRPPGDDQKIWPH